MRSLRKRLEAVATNYQLKTNRTACAELECWMHSTGDKKIFSQFRFSWFTSDSNCQTKIFPDLELMEDFVSTEAYKNEAENA